MAHELQLDANGKASMFYTGQIPWHGLGTKILNAATAEEAIKLANLDFEVAKTPVKYNIGRKQHSFKDRFVTYRTDTEAALGTVGAEYTPLQNKDAFAFFDPLVERNEAIYETGGILFDGRRTWLMAKMPESIVLKGDDIIDQYVILSNSHDGSSGVVALTSAVRVVCQNTLQAALSQSTNKLVIRHTTNVMANLAEAHKVLGLRNQCTEALKEAYDLLQKKKVDTKFITEFLDMLYPKNEETLVRTNGDAIKENILASFENGPGHELKSSHGTAFGLYNGVTHVIDHVRQYKTPNSKLQSIWFGNGARTEQKAFDLLLKMSKN